MIVGPKELASDDEGEVKIEDGKRVRLRVVLRVVDGDPIEENVVEYFQGAGTMLPGLERAIAGLRPGEARSGVLPSRQAFGDPALQSRKSVHRREFPAEAKLEVGMEFVAKDAQNQRDVVLRIEAIGDERVDVRVCHPLWDRDIEYQVEVLSVTDPKPPPLPADVFLGETGDKASE